MIDQAAIDALFLTARTHNKWTPEPVSEAELHQLYDILKMGPTSANCSPARFVFVTTPEGKEKLRPALSSGNLEKTMSAPVTVIIGIDTMFYEKLPALVPACRCAVLVHQQPGPGRGDRLPQRHPAGRLSDDGGAGASGSMSAPCPASTRPRWTRPSSPAPR